MARGRGVGRPKIRPKEVRAIDSDTLRRKLRARGVKPCIPRRKMREEAGSQWLRDRRWREPLPGFLTSGG
ncbi:hypothetical protein M1O19_06045 [Dehalococcoidia bacterium]|nr:hypothetical protein [Dehalococcoidia bacterium]